MASYPPPIEDLPIFNSLVFTEAQEAAANGTTPTALTYLYTYNPLLQIAATPSQNPASSLAYNFTSYYTSGTLEAGTWAFYLSTTQYCSGQYEGIPFSNFIGSGSAATISYSTTSSSSSINGVAGSVTLISGIQSTIPFTATIMIEIIGQPLLLPNIPISSFTATMYLTNFTLIGIKMA